MKKFIGQIEYDISSDEYLLNFPARLADELGWSEDIELEWIIEEDGKVILRKKEEQE